MGKEKIYFLSFIFFLSGMSAIIYQIAWQKLLLQNQGSDTESVTIIVSTFMAGLGFGALMGGFITNKFKNLIFFFCIFEFLIGAFGLISFDLFLFLSNQFVSVDYLFLIFINFLFFFIPTLLMGATLPILTVFILRKIKNVGDAIGLLYKSNTLGSALSAILTGFILFIFLDLKQSIILASCLNIFISFIIYKKFVKV